MALTSLDIIEHVEDLIDVDDATTRLRILDFVNITGRDIWMAHPWPERHAEGTITTLAPYSTGTVSTSSATVTGSGTTFPTTFTAALAKFSRSYDDPFYTVTTRDSATQLTLAENYLETALSGATYVYFQDTYNLESDVDSLIDLRLQKQGADGPLAGALERRMDEAAYFSGRSGYPEAYAMVKQSSASLKRVRLWPAPDAQYRIKYRYLKSFTDMAADSAESVIPESRRDLLICGTLRYAYRLKDEYQKALAEEQLFGRLLKQHWEREKDEAPVRLRLGRYDRARGGPRYPFDLNTIGVPL